MRLLLAVAIAIGTYALWYRLQVGPFCPAMWFGTAPPVILGLVGVTAYRMFGRFGGEP